MFTQEESSRMIKDFNLENHKQKLLDVWNRHSRLIIYSVLVLALAGVLWAIFCWYSQNQSEKYSAILHQAIIDEQNGQVEKSLESLKAIYNGKTIPDGVKGISSLKYASELLASGKSDAAVKTYIEINKNSGFDQYIREYAGLTALRILVGADKNSNKDQTTALIADLEKSSKILKYYVLEQKGIFKWLQGDLKGADQIFQDLAGNPEASDQLKKRASQMHNIYGLKFGFGDSGKVKAAKKDK